MIYEANGILYNNQQHEDYVALQQIMLSERTHEAACELRLAIKYVCILKGEKYSNEMQLSQGKV